jgi:hypothetical protein
MEGSLSTPCVTSSFWGCRHGRFIGSQSVLLVHLILGCVGWFFESVVGWVLDLGCQLKMVVVFEFYSPGWTSYAGCLQLVTMAVFSASYLWWFFSHIVKIGTQSVSYGISYRVDTVRVVANLYPCKLDSLICSIQIGDLIQTVRG